MKIEIRYAKLEDATRLVEIYRYYVEKTAIQGTIYRRISTKNDTCHGKISLFGSQGG